MLRQQLHTVFSLKENFEVQKTKNQPVAKPACSVNTNMVKNASITLIDVQQLSVLSFCLIF